MWRKRFTYNLELILGTQLYPTNVLNDYEGLKSTNRREVVVAQLVERLLPTPEVRGSNPVTGNIYVHYQLYWKDENKEKRGREWPNFFLKKQKQIIIIIFY